MMRMLLLAGLLLAPVSGHAGMKAPDWIDDCYTRSATTTQVELCWIVSRPENAQLNGQDRTASHPPPVPKLKPKGSKT